MFSPASGWEDLEGDSEKSFLGYRQSELEKHGGVQRAGFAAEQGVWELHASKNMFFRCFLPLITVCALTEFIRVIYGNYDFIEATLHAAVEFMTLFLSSQVARYVMLTFLPRWIKEKQQEANLHGRWFAIAIYPLAYLGLIMLIENIVKGHIALLSFLPFYSIFMIWKGWKIAGIDEKYIGQFVILSTVAILGSVYVFKYILNALL